MDSTPCAKPSDLLPSILVAVSILAIPLHAAEPPITFQLSFEQGINAQAAAGKPEAKWLAEEGQARFSDTGIHGRALLVEKNGEAVQFEAKDNIPTDRWTISFWVKGLDGADWNQRGVPAEDGKTVGVSHFTLLEMFGTNGWTRFYKYGPYERIFLLTQIRLANGKKQNHTLWMPDYEERAWHHHAIVWQKGKGTKLFLDGRLIAEDAAHEVAEQMQTFRLGQTFGADDQRRLIDELIIRHAALPPSDIFREYITAGSFRTPQHARLTQTTQRLSVDGVLDDGQWQHATVVTGLIDASLAQPAQTPTSVLMMYDDAHLYVACHSDLPLEAKRHIDEQLLHGFVSAAAVARDQDMSADDTVTLTLQPNAPDGDLLALQANGVNTRSDHRITRDGRTLPEWNPDWQVATKAGMDGWTVEMSIPFAALGTAAPTAGTTWGLDVQRQWRRLKNAVDTWCWGLRDPATGKAAPVHGLGTVTFGGFDNVAVNLSRLGPLHQGRLDLDLMLTALGAPTQVTVTLGTEHGPFRTETVDLTPGTPRRWRCDADLTQGGAGLLTVDVSAADAAVNYLHQEIPFYVPEQLAVTGKHYPSQQRLLVQWLVRRADIAPEQLSARIEIWPAQQADAPAKSELVPSPLPIEGSCPVKLEGLPSGNYLVKIVLVDGGKPLTERQLELTIQPMPQWLGNTLGLSDVVPPPWTPVRKADDTLSVWGRQLDYDGALLPQRLFTRGENVLAAPVRLDLDTGAGVVSSTDLAADTNWTKVSDTVAQSVRTLTCTGLTVQADITTEFDGFTWIRLEVAPTGPTARIDRLSFVVPLKPRWAELINPYDYGCRLTGKLPAGGFTGTMRPLWLGNRTGGLQVIAETDSTWLVDDANHELAVTHKEGCVELSLKLIDHAVELTTPVAIEFGFILTPVKPPPERYRNWRVYTPRQCQWRDGKLVNNGYHVEYEKISMPAKRDIEIIDIWANGWGQAHAPSGEVHYPIPKADITAQHWTRPLFWGGTCWSFAYAQLHNFWAESPEFKQFQHEWVSNTDASYIPKPGVTSNAQSITVCQASKSYQDFVLYAHKRLLDQANPRGFYFDVSRPVACNNVHHGCGHRNASDGRLAATTNFLGTRRLLKRVYTQLKQHRPDGLIFFHMSGQTAMPIYAFCDAMVDGENYTSILNRKDVRSYEKVLDLDTFAAQYNTQNNMGPVSVFLPEFQRSGAIRDEEWEQFGTRPADYIYGLILLHDGQLWWAYIHYPQLMKLFHALDELDWSHDYEFVPYWTQAALPLPDGVKASFYCHKQTGRAIAVVMNVNDAAMALNAPLDSQALGLPQPNRARDALHGEPCSLDNGALQVTIPAQTFRLIVLDTG